MFLKKECPQCGKPLQEEVTWGTSKVSTYKCGHILEVTVLSTSQDIDKSPSSDGKQLFPFQEDGVRAIIDSNARILVGDEMGLGKTVQAIKTLTSRPELLPVAVFCKSSVRVQWIHEIMRWSNFKFSCQPITDSKDKLERGHHCYVFSLDLLRRFNGELLNQFLDVGIRTVIIDECQLIKNHRAKRSVCVRELCRGLEHVIALSGTPIKNRAPEFFSVWNILLPEKFPVYERYLADHVNYYYDDCGRAKYGGLRDPEYFYSLVGKSYIRRLREDVMPQLPKVNRGFRFFELGEKVNAAYEKVLEEFQEYYESEGNDPKERQINIMAYLAKMRHLTGLAKIEPTVNFIEEFLLDNERQIAIFVHHKDVHQLILGALKPCIETLGLKAPISLTADMDADQRGTLQRQFLDGQSRVLIASELAFGEGLNLQSCSDCVLVERQWNPANEEQAEARFIRIGQKSQSVNSTYIIATGTVDEYLTEIVEQKREIVKSSLGDGASDWVESEIIKELCEKLMGRKKWKL